MKNYAPLLCSLLCLAAPLQAASLQWDTTTLGQAREAVNGRQELPINEYLGLGVAEIGKWQLGVQTDMRYVRDFQQSLHDYDLYQALLHFRPVESVQVDFGRQFVNQGFSVQMLDGIQTTFYPHRLLEIGVYSGIPRSVERGDFNQNDGLITGLSVGLRDLAHTRVRLHAAWQKNNTRLNDLRRNDAFLVGLDLSQQFQGTQTLYALAEYDTTAKVLNTGTAGIDLYPTRWLALNTEFNYFNVNRDTNRPTILGLFTQGHMLTWRFSSTWTFTRYLQLVESYAYQSIEAHKNDRRNGHLLEVGLPVSWETIGLYFQPSYYLSRSFGGNAQGVRLSAHEDLTERWFIDAAVDFASYRKITNDNDIAFSSNFWTGYEILKDWTLAAGIEYNNNNLLTRDVRGSMRIDYHYGHKI